MRCQLDVIDLYFDNIGNYVIKNYSVSFEKTKTADFITTAMQIVIDQAPNHVQTIKELGPIRCKVEELPDIHEKMENEIEMGNKLFREYRYRFVSALFPLVSPEDDDVDSAIKEMEDSTKRICSNDTCNRIFEGMIRKCDDCGSQVVKNNNAVTIKSSKFADCRIDVGIDSGKNRHPIMKMA